MSRRASPTLAKVLAGELCSGCGLCAGVSAAAVDLVTVEPGYTRPRQVAPLPTGAEAKIAQACPGSKVHSWSARADVYWGPAEEVFTAHATDPDVRHQASSGGALSAIAIQALADNLVDAVLHVVADPQWPTRNRVRLSRSRAGVLEGAGSRYAASSPLRDIDDLLSVGERYAIIAKPCDISALRQLGTIDPRVDRCFVLKLSFFCGGIPSHAGADRIASSMGLEPTRLVRFRYRGFGWPGKTVAEADDGTRGEMSYADSWGSHLSKQVQFRCKICPDAVGGVADIAAADAWYGGETGYPQFDEREGRSLLLARTSKGSAFVERCRETGALVTQPLRMREIDLMQPSQANRKRMVAARVLASRSLGQPVPEMNDLCVAEASQRAPLRLKLRNYLGTAKRIIQGRR